MEQNKWLYRLLSHVSAFTLGAYTYGSLHGNTPELYRWILTGLFGIIFFAMSLPKNKINNGTGTK